MGTMGSSVIQTARHDAAAGSGLAVEITHLRKTYGPLGAGKPTTVECAIGLRRADAGSIRLLGLDPGADRDRIREIVGVQLQASAMPARLRVGEILAMYRSFYRDPADVGELIEA